MTDGDALRRAVLVNRDDDTPRLIYADWLDENGQSDRAALIRAQVEESRAEPYSARARAAENRAARLLEVHRKAWTRHLYGKVVEAPRFQRGFIEHVTVEPVEIDSITSIFEMEPLQSLKLVRPENAQGSINFLPVFELKQLGQIRQLEISARNGFLHDEYMALLKSPHLDGLQKLSLRGNPIDPPWFVEMLRSNACPALTGLDVSDVTHIGPRLLIALSKISHREFKNLDVSRVGFDSERLQQLLACRCLSNLEELRLGFSGLAGQTGPLFQLDIGWVIPWTRLVLLDLNGQRLGDDGVHAIAVRGEAKSLRWLSLANNDLGAESVRLLLKSKDLALSYLDLRGNRFTPSAIAALKERFPEALIVS
jgi:uncharacterized protein (TIGR02996 family)